MVTQPSHDKAQRRDQNVSDEAILKISKEITVKFIEVGRITPATFADQFKIIYTSIESTVRKK